MQKPDCYRRIVLLILSAALSTPLTANVVGVDTQNFNPVTDGLDFVTVHSTKTLEPGVFNFGLFLNYAVNTLPYFDVDSSPFKKEKLKDSLTGIDANIGYGLTGIWSIGLSVPQVAAQSVEKTEDYHGQFGQTGITEVRVNSKIRLLGRDRGGIAIVATANQNLIEDNPYAGKNPGTVLTGELVLDRTFGSVATSLNLGYRKRRPGSALEDAPVSPMRDQWIGSIGTSFLVKPISSKIIAEIFVSAPAQKSEQEAGTSKSTPDRQMSSSEGLLGLKHDVSNQLAIHGGAGAELAHGVASPDWRFYVGVNYATGIDHKRKVSARKRRSSRQPQAPKPSLPTAADFQAMEDTEEAPLVQQNPFTGTPPAAGSETFIIQDVHFAYDKDNVVLVGAKDILSNLVVYLNKAPAFKLLEIEGHTDYMGSDSYNQDLSERRANAIRDYLVKFHRLDANKIKALGRGESFPIADNGNYQGRQLNRRVEFIITRGP